MDKKTFTIKTKDGDFKVSIWFDARDKAFLVKGITLPEVVTFGRTLNEAKKMAREALELYCQCVIDDHQLVIDESGKAIGKVPKSHVVRIA